MCWWYRVRWLLAFAFASVRMGSCHMVTQERKCKHKLSMNYVHNYFIRSVFRVHLYSAMYSPPVLLIKSRSLMAWLWLFNSQAEPKAVTGCYFGPAWPGLFGLSLARLMAWGRAKHSTNFVTVTSFTDHLQVLELCLTFPHFQPLVNIRSMALLERVSTYQLTSYMTCRNQNFGQEELLHLQLHHVFARSQYLPLARAYEAMYGLWCSGCPCM